MEKSEKWEIALDKFLEDWRERDDVEGAILTGSYAVGNATPQSDIDVHIVLSEDTDWRERGNVEIDGYLIEYFSNPPAQLIKYLKEDHKSNTRTDARMYATGKILFDKQGLVQQLKENAKKELQREFHEMSSSEIELAKYHLWDNLDNLKELERTSSPNFAHLYHLQLHDAIEKYVKYLKFEVPASAKLHKLFTDSKFRSRYQMQPFPDEQFARQIVNCLEEEPSLSNIDTLTKHVIEKMGGFDINGWKLRSPVEGK